jgi:lactate permease
VAVALWAGIWLANLTVGTPLAGALGSLVAVAVTLGLVWLRERRVPSMDGRVGRALLPYLVLIVLLLGSQALVAVLAGGQPEAWASVVASPAVWLLATAAATSWLLGTGPGAVPPALGPAVRRWWPVAVTTICFLALGGLMTPRA